MRTHDGRQTRAHAKTINSQDNVAAQSEARGTRGVRSFITFIEPGKESKNPQAEATVNRPDKHFSTRAAKIFSGVFLRSSGGYRAPYLP